MNGKFRLPLLVLLLGGAGLLACSPHPAGEATLPDDPAAARRVLLDCPRGDALWRAALGRAGGDETALAELQRNAEQAQARCPARWEPSWAAAETLFRRSRLDDAAVLYGSARQLARSARDDTGIACSANRLGSLAYFRGALEEAEKRFEEALASARRAQRIDLEAFVLNNLAGLLKERGRPAEAVAVFRRAAELLDRLDLPKPARDAAYNEATLLLSLGDAAGARAALDAVAREAESAGDGEVLNLVRIAEGTLALLRENLDAAQRAFAEVTREVPQFAVSAEMGLGRVALARGRYDEAAAHLDTAARTARAHDLLIDALLANTYGAQALLEAGRIEQAIGGLQQVREEADRAGSREYIAWLSRWMLGRAHERMGSQREAIALYEEAAAILDTASRSLDPLGPGMHFLAERSDPYSSLALALVHSGAPPVRVLAAVERAHARSLRRAGTADAPVPQTAALAQISAGLRPGELLIDFLLAQEGGVAVAVSREGSRAVRVPGWDRLRAPLERYREAMTRPLHNLVARARPRKDLARDLESGRLLSEALLGPFRDELSGVHRLLVVPDGELALIPLAALPAPDTTAEPTFLGERFETAVLPMAGWPPRWTGPRTPVLLAGDPLPDPERRLPTLPRAEEEIATIGAIWNRDSVTIARGEAFTPRVLLDASSRRYGTIHLATHAIASTLDPRGCAVFFSTGQRLGFDRIARLRLPPALVVLSACDTGSGELVPGEGVVGLTWAFLSAGARGVVASLWRVDDASAAELMEAFHRNLRRGDDPLRALALARRAAREARAHPAYWAPFEIVLHPEQPPSP